MLQLENNRSAGLDYFSVALLACPRLQGYSAQHPRTAHLEDGLTLVFIAPFLLQLQETQDHFKDCPPLVAL